MAILPTPSSPEEQYLNYICANIPNNIDGVNYSTNETFTGRYWIDGKMIYAKGGTGTGPVDTINPVNMTSVGTIPTTGEVVSINFAVYRTSDNARFSNCSNYFTVYVTNSGLVQAKANNADYINKPYMAIIEYTK